jgi:hypothetical protein
MATYKADKRKLEKIVLASCLREPNYMHMYIITRKYVFCVELFNNNNIKKTTSVDYI